MGELTWEGKYDEQERQMALDLFSAGRAPAPLPMQDFKQESGFVVCGRFGMEAIVRK